MAGRRKPREADVDARPSPGDDVVDPWVVLRRLMAENRALRAERDELRARVDELELRQFDEALPDRTVERPVVASVTGPDAPQDAISISTVATEGERGAPDDFQREAAAVEQPDLGPRMRPWQRDALAAWAAAGHRGVVEAVTGAGKTFVGISATREALVAGGRAVVIVPTTELQDQWWRVLAEQLPDAAIGKLGGGRRDDLADCDVLVAIVNSAARRSLRPRPGDLLIADECHRYGTPSFALALEQGFDQRLGLTATFEREDDGVEEHLHPYFGDVVFNLWYDRALADGVIAPFDIALVGVQLTTVEQRDYDACSERMDAAARNLEWRHGIPREPYDQFMAELNRLAKRDRRDLAAMAALAYLGPMTARRALLAQSRGKLDTLAVLEPAVRRASGALVFTQTKESAESAAGLFEEAGIPASALYSGLDRDERRDRMDAFRDRAARLLAAPRVLDEGVDVPEADLAVVVAASRSRRQLVQRLGRVLRPKSDGRPARLVMLYAKGTVEDPTLYGDSPLAAVIPHSRRHADFSLPAQRSALLTFLLGSDPEPDALPDPPSAPEPTAVRSPRTGQDEPHRAPARPQQSTPLQAKKKSPRKSAGERHAEPLITPSLGRVQLQEAGGFQWDDEEPEAARQARKEAELTASADSVHTYLKQISRFPLLNAEEEVDLAKRIEAGLYACELLRRAGEGGIPIHPQRRRDLNWITRDGAAAKARMVEANLRLVVSLAKRHTGRGMAFLDLVQEGNLGLIRAVEKFDYKEGLKFSTYATWWIRQAISRALADQARTIRIPVHMVEKLNVTATLLRQARKEGWFPRTAAEIAAATGQSLEDAEDYLRWFNQSGSLDDLLAQDPEYAWSPHFRTDDRAQLERFEWSHVARPALHRLAERERQILRMRFGFDHGEPMTLDEIGSAFGVTRERIRQLEKKTLDQLAVWVDRDYGWRSGHRPLPPASQFAGGRIEPRSARVRGELPGTRLVSGAGPAVS